MQDPMSARASLKHRLIRNLSNAPFNVFHLEFFNALNHAVLGDPNTTLNNPNFVRILTASGGGNIQLALKYAF